MKRKVECLVKELLLLQRRFLANFRFHPVDLLG
jgi:hypothetical protein